MTSVVETADRALLCAFGAFALHSEDGYAGIERLVYSEGDSDFIAAIGGALIGARIGYRALEAQAVERRVKIQGVFEPRYERELLQTEEFLGAL